MKKILALVLTIALILSFSIVCAAEAEEIQEETTDVIVVGGGGSGLSAAYWLNEGGKKVVLLEKNISTGGNTRSAGFFAANSTHFHDEFGVTFSEDDQFDFLMETDGVDEAFARKFVENSGSTAEWVLDTLGIVVTNVVGREIYAVAEDGSKLPNQLATKLAERDAENGIDIRVNSKAVKLLTDDSGAVIGVEVEGPEGIYHLMADAVLLATGGFSANETMIKEYGPEWSGLLTTNASSTTGDGIIMAQEVGAAVSNMSEFTINPTTYNRDGVGVSISGVRYEGGILVTYEGKRFTDEMANYTDVSIAERDLAGGKAWAIMDTKALACNPAYAVTADTIEDLAKLIEVDPEVLFQTVSEYQIGYDANDDAFGRTDLRSRIDEAPFYAVPVEIGVHHTRGGISIDIDGHVLNTEGAVINGLYASGEVTDNKLLGNDPVAVGVTFGRLTAGTVLSDLAALESSDIAA